MKTLKIAIRIILILFLLFVINGLDCRMKVRHYQIESDKLSSDLKIAILSDLHSCNYGKGERRIVKKIDRFRPDLIFLIGDIYDDERPMDITTEFFNNIGKRYSCWYVVGNHEVKSGNLDTIKTMIKNSGTRYLENEKTMVKVRQDTINLCGVVDVTQLLNWNRVRAAVDSLSRLCDTTHYTILLHHRPELIEIFMESPFDMVTAGHYHGGQFRLPWMKEGVYAPDHAGELKYTGGLYPFGNDRYAVVSRGLSRESTRIPRFYIRPELVLVTVHPKK